jgi:hypothetical protein
MIATFRHADFSGTYRDAFTDELVTVTHADRDYRWLIWMPDGKAQEVNGTDMSLLISSRLLEKEPTT